MTRPGFGEPLPADFDHARDFLGRHTAAAIGHLNEMHRVKGLAQLLFQLLPVFLGSTPLRDLLLQHSVRLLQLRRALGDEFLEAVKTGDPVTIHEDGTVEVG